MNTIDSIASPDQSLKSTRRRKSRYLSSSPNTSVSPVRRYPVSDPNLRISFDDPTTSATKALWPKTSSAASSTGSGSKKIETLAEHLANLRLKDLLSDNPLSRQKIPVSTSRRTEENHKPVLGKLRSSSAAAASGSGILPGRFSVDENSLNRSTSHHIVTGRLAVSESDRFRDAEGCASHDSESSAAGVRKTASFSSYMSSTATSTSRRNINGVQLSSKFMRDSAISSLTLSNASVSKTEDSSKQMRKSILKSAMRRANSLTGNESLTSQWALSPARKGSNLKPLTSPQKSAKGVEKLLNFGMELFKTKKFTSTSPVHSVRSGNAECAHKLMLLHCRLMQWRFANVKEQTACENITKQAEMNLIFAHQSLVSLRHSVTRKRLKYQRESLLWKLNFILHSQMKLLETWGGMESHHTSAVSITKDSLLAVVCKVPLIEGVKVDTQLASLTLREASELTASITTIVTTLLPLSGDTSMLLSELAKVVAQEKFLIEECLEMSKTISILEFQERSLRSTLIQLAASKTST